MPVRKHLSTVTAVSGPLSSTPVKVPNDTSSHIDAASCARARAGGPSASSPRICARRVRPETTGNIRMMHRSESLAFRGLSEAATRSQLAARPRRSGTGTSARRLTLYARVSPWELVDLGDYINATLRGVAREDFDAVAARMRRKAEACGERLGSREELAKMTGSHPISHRKAGCLGCASAL